MVGTNSMDLSGRTAIITGAGQGLGEAMAKALAQVGSNIVIADINEKNAQKTSDQIKAMGVESLAYKLDVTREEQVEDLVKMVKDEFGSIDILINNAGICQKVKTEEQDFEDWKRIFDVNVHGVYLMSKAVGKVMIQQNKGSIINMASMSSFIVNREPQNAYNSSKAAVAMMTKCLASEWVDYNIRVNAIAPGYMRTDMAEPLFKKGGELEHLLELVPMKRLGEPEELGSLAVYLASDASSFATGSVINIDGGYTIW
ncbi:glucose 1-dehydrogenase [Pullulanibacillus sp. KACC 23026]|uniref:SDR family NAD(P)-dependent oxidoreductase n=1 Tax=Pullulanibacillus sp. KACC 23026 TaxID=3028315 RepID=UPI0023B078AC|nr:glucose 1-dehydrogenase [Pullulanibacillus sp. KACC 23026]WEG13448.1 glucose 1-dehydrogenase [Pullulanibacillus sp. KACC 23026]